MITEQPKDRIFDVGPDEFARLVDFMGGGIYVVRLLCRINIGSKFDCWEWEGARDKRGYGAIRTPNKLHKAHRCMAMLFLSDQPLVSQEHVIHSCDNPPCCNPYHLRIGTHADNMADMFQKGRRKAARGEQAGNVKLTQEDVNEIRKLYSHRCRKVGQRVSDLAERFGVTRQQIRLIGKGEAWKH